MALNELECVPSPSVRSIPTARPSCESTGQLFLFSEMSESSHRSSFIPTPSAGDAKSSGSRNTVNSKAHFGVSLTDYVRGDEGRGRSTLSAAASPVRTSVLPERAQALRASAAACGRSTPELLARYDHATSSWRTSQLCLDGALSEFSETWPRSGMMRNGIAYQLAPLVRLTDETGSGSWATPTSRAPGGSRPHDTDQLSGRLANQIGGSLNPTWVEWLMGFPLGWTDLEPSAMPSSRRSRRS